MFCLQLLGQLFRHSGKVLPELFKSVLADLNRWDIGLWIHSRSSRPWAQIDSRPVRVCRACFFWDSFHCLPSTFYNGLQAVIRIVEIVCYDDEPVKISTSKPLRGFFDMARVNSISRKLVCMEKSSDPASQDRAVC